MVGGANVELLARALGDLKDAVLITAGQRNDDGVRPIVFVNRAFCDMTGFAAHEAVGALPDITIGPETNREVLGEIEAARAALEPVRVELLKYRKDRSTFWAELDVVPVLDEAGVCSHYLGVMRDVTQRHLSHARAADAERLTSLGTLAAGLAHELASPLSVVVSNADYVHVELRTLEARGVAIPPEVMNALGELGDSVARIAEVVRGVRVFARSGPVRGRAVHLESILRDVVRLARAGVPASPSVVIAAALEEPVRGDRELLAQVFLNVIVNALQASPPGNAGPPVEVKARRDGSEAVVEVIDHGAGIPAANLSRIFDPFFTTKPSGALGLGLSVARSVVNGLGGTIEVESTKGRGTTCRVRLKLAEV